MTFTEVFDSNERLASLQRNDTRQQRVTWVRERKKNRKHHHLL